MARLVVCSECSSHVLASETTCPHCGSSVGRGGAVGRTAGAVLLGLALTGCPADEETMNESMALYGTPTSESDSTGFDGDTSGSSSSSSGEDTTGGMESGSSSSSSGGDTDTDTSTGPGEGSTSISPDYGVPTTTGE